MNILIINHYAGNSYYGMEFRPYYLAREWIKRGHNVTILAASYSHLRHRNPVVKSDFQEEDVDGIRYVWLKTPEYKGSLARIRNIMTFVFKLQRNARRIADQYKPDLVIASSTYTIDNFPAYKIAKRRSAQYSYEIHDLWPLSPRLIGGYSKFHPFILVMQWGENFAYKHVNTVVSLLWNAEKHCKEHGLREGRFVCVPNGFYPEEWAEDKFSLPLPKEHQELFDALQGKTIVGFAGGFAASGAVVTLVKAAVKLRHLDTIHFVLVGNGPEIESYESIIKNNNLNNVSILPSVSKELVPAINSKFDICYLGGLHSELHQYGTSYNKMTDYMLSGKPIIQSVDEPGSVVERVGCGIRVEAENEDAVAKAIIQLVDKTAREREEIGLRGKEYVETHLEWKKLAEDFLKPFKES